MKPHIMITAHPKRKDWFHVTVEGVRLMNAKKCPSGLYRVSPIPAQFDRIDQVERMMNEEAIENLAMRSQHVIRLLKKTGQTS